jgi:FkbM family methyltransferase
MIVVQIGTNNGNDHVRDFCLKNKPSKIVLVEPFSIHVDQIKENYKNFDNVQIEILAITPDDEKEKTLYYSVMDGPVRGPECSYQVTSIKSEHLLKHHYKSETLREFKVKSMTLNELFLKHSLTKIDYLFLDIEGIDFEVLQTIDFNSFNIKNIQIETLHINKPNLYSFMKDNGYKSTGTTFDKHGFDELFTKNS